MRINQTPAEPEISFEHKFVFARCHESFVMGFLRFALRSDPTFGAERISSIYYDTPALDLYQEKRASTFLKTKVRVRWYGDASTVRGNVKCYLEIKSKTGGTRQKERFPLELPASLLTRRDLSAPELARVADLLPSFGHALEGAIVPTIMVQYERQRFEDPATGTRVAVDTAICCPAVNRQFIPAEPPRHLHMCVLEIKGTHRDLPGWFGFVRSHVRREAFSKYASCFEHLHQPAGRRE